MWIVEIRQQGGVWAPVSYCVTREQADRTACAPHILAAGETRVREYGKTK